MVRWSIGTKLAAARNLTQPPQAASPSRTCSIGWVRSISVPSFRSCSSASFDRFESVESNGGAERSLPKPRWLCAACVGHHAPPLVTTSLKWTEASFDSLRFPAQPTRPALRMEFKEFWFAINRTANRRSRRSESTNVRASETGMARQFCALNSTLQRNKMCANMCQSKQIKLNQPDGWWLIIWRLYFCGPGQLCYPFLLYVRALVHMPILLRELLHILCFFLLFLWFYEMYILFSSLVLFCFWFLSNLFRALLGLSLSWLFFSFSVFRIAMLHFSFPFLCSC